MLPCIAPFIGAFILEIAFLASSQKKGGLPLPAGNPPFLKGSVAFRPRNG